MEASLEKRLVEEIGNFDLRALFDLLAQDGYGEDDLELRSHRTTLHQEAVVYSIELQPGPPRRAAITLNVGLLAVQSPLPSFLLKLVDRLDHEALTEFIGFFDDRLLRARVASLFPERDESLLPGWERSRGDRLRLLRVSSPSTLHWLFRTVYPEAEVTVARSTIRRPIASEGIRLGATSLGDGAAVGGFANVPADGFDVTLYVVNEIAPSGAAWAVEARKRLDRSILPLLAEVAMPLTVVLALRDQSSFAHIKDQKAPVAARPAVSYLGYDPLAGGPEHVQRVVLFSGNTEDAAGALH